MGTAAHVPKPSRDELLQLILDATLQLAHLLHAAQDAEPPAHRVVTVLNDLPGHARPFAIWWWTHNTMSYMPPNFAVHMAVRDDGSVRSWAMVSAIREKIKNGASVNEQIAVAEQMMGGMTGEAVRITSVELVKYLGTVLATHGSSLYTLVTATRLIHQAAKKNRAPLFVAEDTVKAIIRARNPEPGQHMLALEILVAHARNASDCTESRAIQLAVQAMTAALAEAQRSGLDIHGLLASLDAITGGLDHLIDLDLVPPTPPADHEAVDSADKWEHALCWRLLQAEVVGDRKAVRKLMKIAASDLQKRTLFLTMSSWLNDMCSQVPVEAPIAESQREAKVRAQMRADPIAKIIELTQAVVDILAGPGAGEIGQDQSREQLAALGERLDELDAMPWLIPMIPWWANQVISYQAGPQIDPQAVPDDPAAATAHVLTCRALDLVARNADARSQQRLIADSIGQMTQVEILESVRLMARLMVAAFAQRSATTADFLTAQHLVLKHAGGAPEFALDGLLKSIIMAYSSVDDRDARWLLLLRQATAAPGWTAASGVAATVRVAVDIMFELRRAGAMLPAEMHVSDMDGTNRTVLCREVDPTPPDPRELRENSRLDWAMALCYRLIDIEAPEESAKARDLVDQMDHPDVQISALFVMTQFIRANLNVIKWS